VPPRVSSTPASSRRRICVRRGMITRVASRTSTFRRHRASLAIASVVVVWIIDGCVSLGAPRFAECVSSLLFAVAVLCAMMRETREASPRHAGGDDVHLLALSPCLALALAAMLDAWWRGFVDSDGGATAATGALVVALLPTLIAMWFAGLLAARTANSSIDLERWLPRSQRFAKVLAGLAALLVVAAVARRVRTATPDALNAAPIIAMPTLPAAGFERVVLRVDADRELIVRGAAQSEARLEVRDRRAESLRIVEWIGWYTRIQFDRRIRCLRVANWGRATVYCFDAVDRRATAWTQRRTLAPTYGWIAMGVIAIGLLGYAARRREHRRWRRAVTNVDESVTIDRVRFDAAQGVKIPHSSHEVWVVVDERSSGDPPYREHTNREVLEVRVEPPFERDWREVRWAVASAILFLTPLMFALAVGMITG
jgi:hypothetical protein